MKSDFGHEIYMTMIILTQTTDLVQTTRNLNRFFRNIAFWVVL